jgi:hypothetical protein
MGLLKDLKEAQNFNEAWLAILVWGTEIWALWALVVFKGWPIKEAHALIQRTRWLVEVRYFKHH